MLLTITVNTVLGILYVLLLIILELNGLESPVAFSMYGYFYCLLTVGINFAIDASEIK